MSKNNENIIDIEKNNPKINCIFDESKEMIEDKILHVFESYLYKEFNKNT